MTLSRSTWKLIYGGCSLISKLIAFAIGTFLTRPTLSDLVDLAVGGLFLSSAFVHILPRAEAGVDASYPLASLVAVIVFAALTLFCFIRDSIALMDENILTACDTLNHSAVRSDLMDEAPPPAAPAPPAFLIADHLPTMLLYVVVLAHSAASALWMSSLEAGEMNEHVGVIIALQFLEFVGVARFVRELPVARWVYWALGVVISAASAALIAAPIGAIEQIPTISGYVAAVVLGFYFFLGSIAVHNGLTQTTHSFVIASLTLLLAFAAPAAVRAGEL
jgi:hypothetical protein